MDCSCEIDTYCDDGESVELYKSKEKTARKQHKCHECSAVISPGDKYKFTSYKYDGEFWQERTCGDCLSAIAQFYSGGAYSGILWEDISEHINEYGGDLPESCIVELTPLARGKVCDMIDRTHSRLEKRKIYRKNYGG